MALESGISPSELMDTDGLMVAVEIAWKIQAEQRRKQEAAEKARGRRG